MPIACRILPYARAFRTHLVGGPQQTHDLPSRRRRARRPVDATAVPSESRTLEEVAATLRPGEELCAQHAREQGCWEGVDLRLRARQFGFAGRVERQSGCERHGHMELALPNAHDARRLEVLVDGLPLYGGAQLAIDTTVVPPIWGDGIARLGTANIDGIIAQARRRKERTYPELVGRRSRARFVVLAGEVGGRWSEETQTFLHILARAKAPSEALILRKRVEQVWRMRWAATLACSAVRAFAASIFDFRVGRGADGDVPRSHDVANDFRHVCVGRPRLPLFDS